MAYIGNLNRVVAVLFASALMTACGGGGGGGGGGSPASVVDDTPDSSATTKVALDRSNALFMAGSALAISSASANLYDFFVLTQHVQPHLTPARMSARTMEASTSPFTCADGNVVQLDESYSGASKTSVAHFSNCRLSNSLVVNGDISVTQTNADAVLDTENFQIEKAGKRFLYSVHSHQTWTPDNSTTVIHGSETVSISSADSSWSISSTNASFELTVDNTTSNTLAQSITAKINSNSTNTVQLVNNRIYGENNTSIKVGSGFLFWDLMADEDASIDIELDDNGDYTADLFNTVDMSELLDNSAKTQNHAPVLSAKNNHYYEKIASNLSINASDADHDFLSYDWELISASHSNYFFDQPHSSHPAFGATEAGDFQFVVTVNDGSVSTQLTVNVHVGAIDTSDLSALATQVNNIDLAYGENLAAQLTLNNTDLSGAELRVLSGPDGFSVSQQGVLSWTNDHVYDGGQFNYSFGILRNGYWEKIWYGHVFPAGQ